MQLDNSTAIVTGGSRGLGLEITRQLVDAGATVHILARDKQELAAVVDELGDSVIPHQADVTQYQQLAAVADQLDQAHILVNNAGIYLEGDLLDHTPEQLSQVVNVDLMGVIFATKAFLPLLLEQSEAHILNVSSTSGLKGRSSQAAYAAAKHGVAGFTNSLKVDLDGTPVKVTGFYPGGMNTGLFDQAGSPKDNGDWMDPADVAHIIRFILERDASLVMDQVVVNKRLVQ